MSELSIWEKAMGWRKRQMVEAQVDNEITRKIRNDTIEEIAKEFEKMKNFGDTSASFAVYVRGMKR
jgi:CRISPR/Cas system CMR subunit Cmr6 (Cas7 group RAMP superfamily)